MTSAAHQLLLGEFAVNPRDMWATPKYLFDQLHSEGRFTVDACAVEDSKKLDRYWSPDDDGILQDWRGERVFCNPPYSSVSASVEKCKTAKLACLLVPVSSDVKWFHAAIHAASMIDLFLGRIQFVPPPGIAASTCNGRHCAFWFVASDKDDLRPPLIRSRDAKTGRLL